MHCYFYMHTHTNMCGRVLKNVKFVPTLSPSLFPQFPVGFLSTANPAVFSPTQLFSEACNKPEELQSPVTQLLRVL